MTAPLETHRLLGFRLLIEDGKGSRDALAALSDKTGQKIPIEFEELPA